ncbi:hypothetical protein VTN49DRAFT_581 [Thermomyces lanuginosus]|uniref:uncharacterized protein n=1 Tax=Thermomyces lanuginosus TaxID=5541 RepID=UPI0037441855
MPHATENDVDVDVDDIEFQNVMRQINAPHGGDFEFMTRDLEPGEKAEDAVDYEDIDDEDLPDEEEPSGAGARPAAGSPKSELIGDEDLFGDDQAAAGKPDEDGFDDLFGDVPSSPPAEAADATRDLFEGEKPDDEEVDDVDHERPDESGRSEEAPAPSPEDEMDPETLREYRLQQALFAGAAAPAENMEELLASMWPEFDRNATPRFLELIPHKKAYFVGKQPAKPPKPVMPTKVNLEISPDYERYFRTGGQTKRALESEQLGLVPIEQTNEEEESFDDFDQKLDDNEILPGGITMQQLRTICSDWEVKSDVSSMELDTEPVVEQQKPKADGDEDMWFADMEEMRPTKKRRLGREPNEILNQYHIDIPILDDPEEVTARIAKKVILDMNIPDLMLDTRPEAVMRKPKSLRGARDDLDTNATKRLAQRYNISNDEAYDMLKENHQNKVRSTLGGVTLEHSMPALRLQYPFYKVELKTTEARSFHRPSLAFRPQQTYWFKNPAYIKRKHQRGKDAKTLFPNTKSLSLADNSTMLLLEYSEEVPMMMSNFGMASRFVNYYRRKNADDSTRPKGDIGETHVLLPQDKSPFAIFGHVDPGEITPTITNALFRAPVFQHQPKSNDFLVIRNSTYQDGPTYSMRNIENLYVVGQQFPSVDVPGPHSRKVTTVAKNRLKMLTFRLMRKQGTDKVSISDVTKHLPGTTDMQNRQKMKDFVLHDKDTKQWVPIGGVPDSETIRSWIQPEDVCLLDAMQVGQQHLHDTGYSNDIDDDDDDAEGESLEQQMAPWRATRNFIMASQGKAMLKLHGEGDPTGRGEGFSFIKTSMKGGFKAIGESVEDKLDAQRLKELGGHSYNVAQQQKSYETSIRRIWDAQKASLSSTVEASDDESDIDRDDEVDFGRPTPRDAPTPAFGRRGDDESVSQFSRVSTASQRGKVLKITREYKDSNGQVYTKEQLVWDPRVIRQYIQHRNSVDTVNTKLAELVPTGDPEVDARNKKLLEAELSRLNRNKERRFAREKQKGIARAAAEGEEGAKIIGTQRKCANCGQVGHIKTNKKLCPLLNGTMKFEDRMNDSAFSMGTLPTV